MLIIFDMGGVVTTTAKIEPLIAEKLGISLDDFYKYSGKHTKTDLYAMCSDGLIDTKEFWARFQQASGIKTRTDWWHWLFHPVLNTQTAALIQRLKDQGHRVVCGTNTISAHYFNHMERGDYALFHQTYSSCAMGVSKPDPEFWKIILESEGYASQDTVFTDDRIENIEAAAALGIHSFQFTTAQELEKKISALQ